MLSTGSAKESSLLGAVFFFVPELVCADTSVPANTSATKTFMTYILSVKKSAILAAIAICIGILIASAQQNTGGPWWKHALIYEIYPRSFQDSNGDGTGDLNGITARLDYLKGLGVDAIWISPIYPSPQVDFGYDISDYENVDPQYGTLADFDRLEAAAQQRNIRIIMDMVMNHTSDKHPWFIESRSSRSNPKRDWYVWKDGSAPGPGHPPNNWLSDFGHSAWQYDPTTGQYYYHKFYAQQPDLNWRNPAVKKAMFDAVRFWLDRGVAGFRLDAIPTLFEDPQFRDEEVMPGKNAYGDRNEKDTRTNNLPEVHDVLRDLRKLSDSYPGDRVLIGETYMENIHQLESMYGLKQDELQLPMDMQVGFLNKFNAGMFRSRIQDAESELPAGDQPLFVFDNHDNPRSWNRYGDGVHDLAIAKVIAAMLLTTKATAMMYYGEEIGMVTSTPTRIEDVKDPVGKTGWPKDKGRDGERTPMQWDTGKNAGFSTAAHTWLPVAKDYKTVNVMVEDPQNTSLLNWYKQLIALRRTNPTLRDGSLIMLNTENKNVLTYVRKGNPNVVVALNFTAQPQTLTVEMKATEVSTLATDADSLKGTKSLTGLTLPPFGVWIGSAQ
jgi:alpha-glucosidase